jgi:transketolase
MVGSDQSKIIIYKPRLILSNVYLSKTGGEKMHGSALDELCINTIRFLSADAIEKAKSGHPGTPMGAAALGYVLWDRFLKHHPRNPLWPDRDRFILSPGHASSLLYSLLYLSGYDLSLDDIRRFRQWGSRTPGHPEYRLTPGVEMTTGPLGQGFASGVGMAVAERRLADRYNRPGYEIINHYTWALVSDGDLQEGVASEAASLAGVWKLGKLIYLYDSNDVQQDGYTSASFREDVAQRFRAYGWDVIGPIDGLNINEIEESLRVAQSTGDKPHLIICRTVIGYGSPHKAGTSAAHAEPLGSEEVRSTKLNLKWEYTEPFTVPPAAFGHFQEAIARGGLQEQKWRQKLEAYRMAFPQEALQMQAELNGDLPEGWDSSLDNLFKDSGKSMSTRDASGIVLNAIADKVPYLMGGAADLALSTRAVLKNKGDFDYLSYSGRNLHFGLREHAMGAISNGLSLHGGVIPFAATFLIFSDYMRPPMRLAALMQTQVIYLFTHDSVVLGEDGPTHQPVEQLMNLRLIPGLVMLRPADAAETLEAWRIAIRRRNGPTAMVLTRQSLPVLDRRILAPASGVQRGGYILWESGKVPQVLLIATGSEVHLALEAGQRLAGRGIAVRVVSLPSWELFEAQPEAYRRDVLPPDLRARVSIEAGTSVGWERYIGLDGVAVGVSHFGVSAPGQEIYEKFGYTSENVMEQALKLILK